MAVVSSVFFILLFDKTLVSFRTHSYGDAGDMRFNFLILQWCLDWLLNKVPPGTQNIMDFYIYYPFPNSLALSSNHFGSLPLSLILNLVEKDWFARGNLWIYSSFFLNSLASFHAFWLYLNHDDEIYHQTSCLQRFIFAAVVSVTFSYSLTRIYFIVHVQTLPNFAMPYFFYFGYRAVKESSLRMAILAAVFFSWQFYLDIHLCLMTVFIVICLGPLYLGFIARSPNRFKRNFFQIFVFGIICIVFCLPLLRPYLKTVDIFGSRSLKEADLYKPKERDFFRPSSQVGLYTGLLPTTGGERVVFSSILSFFYASCLLTTSLHLVLRRIREKFSRLEQSWGYTIAPLAALIPSVLMFDFMIHQSPMADFFHLHVPGFDSIRTPGRFSVIFLAIMVSSWIILILTTGIFKKYAKVITLFVCMTIIVLLTESSTYRFARWEKPDLPALNKVFATLKGPAFILPAGWDYLELNRMQMAAKYQIKIANGYSGFQPYSLHFFRFIQDQILPEVLIQYLLEKYYQEVVVDLRRVQIDKRFLKRFGRVEGQYAVFSRIVFNLSDAIAYQGFDPWEDNRNYFSDIKKYISKNPAARFGSQ